MDYVPTNEKIQENFSMFLVNPIQIKGIYGNIDVDSILFSYTTNSPTPLLIIENELIKKHWITHNSTPNELILVRSKSPKNKEISFFSYEISRFFVTNSKVCVGYVQMDSRTEISINTKTSESKWANKHFWPKYVQCKNT